MAIRNIVKIDEEKCDGCGQCVPSCEEGAIRIVQGKAKVVSDIYCDGLGACLGHCPRGAISIVEREAAAFDEEAVARHLVGSLHKTPASTCTTGCPGSAAVALNTGTQVRSAAAQPRSDNVQATGLANWPVQLHLVPPQAPYLQRANLLLVADCVPFACASFHTHILDGRPVVVGCPKLDDCQGYVSKLAAMIQQAHIQSISVVHMEVPCCTGLLRVAQAAIQLAGVSIPLHSTVVTTRGDILAHDAQQVCTTDDASSPSANRQLPIL